MDLLFEVNWKQLFVPDTPLLQVVIRGSVIYVVIFFLVRVIPNRQVGGVGMNDLLLIVLIASAATNALAGDYKSITSGVVLIATIIFWSYLFNWAGHRFPRLHRLFHPTPKPLIKDGRLQHEEMQRELVTEEELIGKLRRQGFTRIEEVKEAHVETDGQISAIGRGSR
ncbi:MAG TPA: YetF domain-containing protein [Pyrinomonadaceae bacterium]|nr:YetF domain-containing protein [Pyrinomonadaceae bacterium]